jgi:hypothetical protein
MARYLQLFLFLTLFSYNILAAVVPKSDGIYDESLSEALYSDTIQGYEQEPEAALVSDIENDERDFNIHAIRGADGADDLDLPASTEDEGLPPFELDHKDSMDRQLKPKQL